jgi:hypothetical protein
MMSSAHWLIKLALMFWKSMLHYQLVSRSTLIVQSMGYSQPAAHSFIIIGKNIIIKISDKLVPSKSHVLRYIRRVPCYYFIGCMSLCCTVISCSQVSDCHHKHATIFPQTNWRIWSSHHPPYLPFQASYTSFHFFSAAVSVVLFLMFLYGIVQLTSSILLMYVSLHHQNEYGK